MTIMLDDLDRVVESIHRKLDMLLDIVNTWKAGSDARYRSCYSCGKEMSPNFYLLRGRYLGLPVESLVRQWNDERVEILCCECYERFSRHSSTKGRVEKMNAR